MRVLIATASPPFAPSDNVNLLKGLHRGLIANGHEADTVELPFTPDCARLDQQIVALRCLDLSAAGGSAVDRLITIGYPAYAIPHPNKVAWLTARSSEGCAPWSQTPVRAAYSSSEQDKRLDVERADTGFLRECRRVFVSSRALEPVLSRVHALSAAGVLYPPPPWTPPEPGGSTGDYFVCSSDGVALDDLRLVIEALRGVSGRFKLILLGRFAEARAAAIHVLIKASRMTHRVELLNANNSVHEVDMISNSRALILAARDESVCRQHVLMAMYARKASIALDWVGAPLELLRDGDNALVSAGRQPDITRAMQKLVTPELAIRLGHNARLTIERFGIDWGRAAKVLMD
jgi:glycosyltransferase involved in cell wall biosynthesis